MIATDETRRNTKNVENIFLVFVILFSLFSNWNKEKAAIGNNTRDKNENDVSSSIVKLFTCWIISLLGSIQSVK